MSGVQLALVADDYGLHEGVNAACADLATRGRLQAISCLVGGRAWRHGVAALRALRRDQVDLGLHLDLTSSPLTLPPHRLASVMALSIARQLDRRALRREIDAQLDAFEQALGHAPDHVDGHQHVHQLPQVREVLVEALLARSSQRPWLRDTRRPATAGRLSKAALIEALGAAALRRRAEVCGFAHNSHLLGVYGFDASPPRYRALLQRWLADACDADLLLCHPAWPAAAGDAIQPARETEAQVLGDDAFLSLVAASGVRLQALGTRPGFGPARSAGRLPALSETSKASAPMPS
jgi:predicted glycoside hydrolase/deacetylase ChbG (UPF0249 family)